METDNSLFRCYIIHLDTVSSNFGFCGFSSMEVLFQDGYDQLPFMFLTCLTLKIRAMN